MGCSQTSETSTDQASTDQGESDPTLFEITIGGKCYISAHINPSEKSSLLNELQLITNQYASQTLWKYSKLNDLLLAPIISDQSNTDTKESKYDNTDVTILKTDLLEQITFPFNGTPLENNAAVISQYWKDFSSKNNGYGYNKYECKQLEINPKTLLEYRENGTLAQWNDYVKFRINAINKILPKVISNETRFSAQFKRYRNETGHFLSHNQGRIGNFDRFKNMLNDLLPEISKNNNEFNDDEMDLLYVLILQICTILYDKFDENWIGNKMRMTRGDQLASQLEEHLIQNIARFGFFGDWKNQWKCVENQEAMDRAKKLVFSNFFGSKDANAFINYLLQDVTLSNFENYAKTESCGLQFMFALRLSFVIFAGIKQILYPKSKASDIDEFGFDLKKLNIFFKFMFYLSLYRCCYARKGDESFYLTLFTEISEWQRKPIFDELHKVSEMSYYDFLRECVYVRNDGYMDGTLLHAATGHNMLNFCILLLKEPYNLDFNKRNLGQFRNSSKRIAEEYNYPKILQLFENEESGNLLGFDRGAALYEKSNKKKVKNLNASEIESSYNQFSLQKASILALLKCLGCSVESNFKGISEQKIYSEEKEANDTMKSIVGATMLALKSKMSVSDDLLMLSLIFCQATQNDALYMEFVKLIQEIGEQCLSEKCMNPNTKTRDYLYFKYFLLESNIWLLPAPTDGDDEKNEVNEQRLLYSSINETVNKALISQKEFIWNHIEQETKTDNNSWQKILHFKDYFDPNLKDLRQDLVENGIVSDIKEIDLMKIQSTMKDETNNYDVFNAANSNIYLTKCLIFAHQISKEFQKDSRKLFESINPECFYQSAPVKLRERCLIKSQTDYGDKPFPTVANICDFVRCSITFLTIKELLKALNIFMEKVKKNESGCIQKIVRIKNGFKDIQTWKSMEQCDYRDIKLNVVILDKASKTTQIGEIQLLTRWLLKAKKRGHKLYGIKRKEEYIESVSNMINTDMTAKTYQTKINKFIVSGNIKQLTKQLVFRPNIVLSMKESKKTAWDEYYTEPMLCKVIEYARNNHSIKLFDVFFGSLYHYNDVLLNSKGDYGFLKNYLKIGYNIDPLDNNVITKQLLYGVHVGELKRNDIGYKIIDSIMKCPHFTGLPSKYHESDIIYECWQSSNVNFYELIIKYASKNIECIKNGINYIKEGNISNWSALEYLLSNSWCNDNKLNLLLFETWNAVKDIDKTAIIDAKILRKAWNNCKKGESGAPKNAKWAKMIKDYAKQTNQSL